MYAYICHGQGSISQTVDELIMQNSSGSYMNGNVQIKSKFVHITTAELLWHVQFCDMAESLKPSLTQKKLHKISFLSSFTVCEMGSWCHLSSPGSNFWW